MEGPLAIAAVEGPEVAVEVAVEGPEVTVEVAVEGWKDLKATVAVEGREKALEGPEAALRHQ